MENSKGLNITTKIQNIKLDDFKIASISKEKKAELDRDKFSFDFTVNIKSDPAKKEITIQSTTKVYSDISKSIFLGEITTTGIFELHNFDEISTLYNGNIPVDIFASFVDVLVATTRGILMCESKGTVLENAIIPIISPLSFFKNITSTTQG